MYLYVTCIFQLWIWKKVNETKGICSWHWGYGVSDGKSSPVKTVANMEWKCWKFNYMENNAIQTWTFYQSGIYKPTAFTYQIREHNSYNPQSLTKITRNNVLKIRQLVASSNKIQCCWHCVVKSILPLYSDLIVWFSPQWQSTTWNRYIVL